MKVEQLDSLIEMQLDQIPTDIELENDLFIYLPQNSRIICLVRTGNALSALQQSQLLKKGVRTIYISHADEKTFLNWFQKTTGKKPPLRKDSQPKQISPNHPNLNRPSPNEPNPSEPDLNQRELNRPFSADRPTPKTTPPTSPVSENISKTESEAFEKRLDRESEKNESFELPLSADEAQKAILKSVDLVFPRLSELVRSIFNLHGNFLTRSHAVHVALYSCLLSIAFKKAEPRTISILTLASLFHDVGLARLPILSVRMLKTHQDPTPLEYQKHVNLGADWIGDLTDGLDNEVIDVIRAHHERFDGQGYPYKQKGFELMTLAQILAMADTLDHLCTGTWDGKKYEIPAAIDAFTSLESDLVHPKYFLPDIYSKAQTLLQSPELASSLISAEERLREHSVF